MSTLTITGTGTDANGVVANYTVTVTQDTFSITPVVSPTTGKVGTTYKLTANPVGGIAPFTYTVPVASGITFTPVSGQSNQWTFVY